MRSDFKSKIFVMMHSNEMRSKTHTREMLGTLCNGNSIYTVFTNYSTHKLGVFGGILNFFFCFSPTMMFSSKVQFSPNVDEFTFTTQHNA